MRQRKQLIDINCLCDFDPVTDRVERRDGRVFVVSSIGYADQEVRPDEITSFPGFCVGLEREASMERLRWIADKVARYPLMSDAGKAERLEAIRRRAAVLIGRVVFSVEGAA